MFHQILENITCDEKKVNFYIKKFPINKIPASSETLITVLLGNNGKTVLKKGYETRLLKSFTGCERLVISSDFCRTALHMRSQIISWRYIEGEELRVASIMKYITATE